MTTNEASALALQLIATPDWINGVAKLNQMLDNVLWYLLCECAPGPTPAQPNFPTAPIGLPGVQPQGGVLGSRLCTTVLFPVTTPPGNAGTVNGEADLAPGLLPPTGPGVVLPLAAPLNMMYPLPSAPLPTQIREVLDTVFPNLLQMSFWLGTTTQINTIGGYNPRTTSGAGGNHADTGYQVFPPGAFTHWGLTGQTSPAPAAVATGCVELVGNIGAQAGTCCPPDPAVLALLRRLEGALIPAQRMHTPFAYIRGAVHSNITGSGQTPLSQLLGVAVTVTTVPPAARALAGNPQYYTNLGWISVSDVDGMLIERRVSQLTFLWIPPGFNLMNSFNWALTPGTTITWQEIQAEP